ncbi:MAG: EAL domain-containing protein [Leptolyngbyaceae cyanobacterium bins.59]|nr:EAL domain-containing protein [Leptolyngbyaceae cyanobacterium bins.59]
MSYRDTPQLRMVGTPSGTPRQEDGPLDDSFYPVTKLAPQHFLLIEDECNKRLIFLEASTYSLGRDADNSIVLNSKWVSRQHAILLRVTNPETSHYAFRIVDGNLQGKRSTNGLVVNNQRCISHDLQHGDEIVLGRDVRARYYNSLEECIDLEYLQSIEPEEISDVLLKLQEQESHQLPEDQGPETIAKQANEAAIVRLASFPELSPTPIVEVDTSGKITYLNPAALKQFPNLRQLGLNHPVLAGVVPKTQERKWKHFSREIQIGTQIFEQTFHYIHESDLIRSYVIDITAHKRTEEALRRSEAKNRALLNAIPDVMFHLQSDGTILNCKLTEDYPLPQSSLDCIGKTVNDVFPPTITNQITQAIHHAQRFHPQVFEYELTWNQQVFSYEARLVVSGEHELLMIIRDMTTRKSYESKLIHDALHDSLTDLPNRDLFINRLESLIDANKTTSGALFGVLFVDLDRFKFINDSLGHLMGDQLLITIARKLEACMEPGDIVARLGGDEFAILLHQITDISHVIRTVERIQRELSHPTWLENHQVFTTASIGIVLSNLNYERPEDMLRDADTAMYQAKSLGKARYMIFDRTMHTQAVALLQLEHDLHRAVERQEFQIYYQPIVSLQSSRVVGFEALLRWHHPRRGIVYPSEFMKLAEETGLILPIGEWVLREACRQLYVWQSRLDNPIPLSISVNLSGCQFMQQNLTLQIQQILQQTGLPAQSLNLEITESVLMENSKLAMGTLSELKALGITLSIDDFGTGYSSLSTLHRFPFDVLKADRSFISAITNTKDTSGFEITRTILTLAHSLGMEVVAEGIETQEQFQQLKVMKCRYGQGFLFAKPLNREAAEAFLAERVGIS